MRGLCHETTMVFGAAMMGWVAVTETGTPGTCSAGLENWGVVF
jgi:hypothetical protein